MLELPLAPPDATRLLMKILQRRAIQRGFRLLGGPGSGNFGHAGRPGEVGGSASDGGPTISGGADAVEIRHSLATYAPEALVESTAKQIAVVKDSAAADKIDEYLSKHYGFDLHSQAESIVDRTRGEIITTKRAAPAAIARTLPKRFQSSEWRNISRHIGADSEDSFADAMSAAFSEKGFMFPIARMSNPAAFPMELIYETLHKWGWFK